MGNLLDEAEALAEAAGDQRRLGRALTHKSIQFVHAGDFGAALRPDVAPWLLARRWRTSPSRSSPTGILA